MKDHLKQLIGNALAEVASRDALARVLRGIGAPEASGSPSQEDVAAEAAPTQTVVIDPTVPVRAVPEDAARVDAPVIDPTVPVRAVPENAARVDAPTRADWSASSASSLQAVLDNVKDAILTVDRDGRVLEANLAATQLFALPAESLCGAHVVAFIPALTDAAALDSHAGSVAGTGVA